MFGRLKRTWRCLLGRHAWGPWFPDLDNRIGRHGCRCVRCGHELLHPAPAAFEWATGCVSHCPRCGRRGVVVATVSALHIGRWVWACPECVADPPGPFGDRLTWFFCDGQLYVQRAAPA
jgi:hypothetical protein